MARYRALTDIFTPAPECRYVQAGDILSDIVPTPPGCVPIPVGWIPPLGVEPLDAAAQTAFFNAGPTGMKGNDAMANTVMNGNRWSDRPVAPPSVYWVLTTNGWTLSGTGSGFRPG